MKYPDDEIFIYSFIFTGKSSVLVRVCLKCEWTSKHSQSHLKIKIVDNLIVVKKDAHRRLTQSIGKNVWLEQDFFLPATVATSEQMCDCAIVTFDKCLADTLINPWIILSMQSWQYQV